MSMICSRYLSGSPCWPQHSRGAYRIPVRARRGKNEATPNLPIYLRRTLSISRHFTAFHHTVRPRSVLVILCMWRFYDNGPLLRISSPRTWYLEWETLLLNKSFSHRSKQVMKQPAKFHRSLFFRRRNKQLHEKWSPASQIMSTLLRCVSYVHVRESSRSCKLTLAFCAFSTTLLSQLQPLRHAAGRCA